MKGRPPVKPTHNLRKKSEEEDEESDKVGELGQFNAPAPRLGLDYSPLPLTQCFDRIIWAGPIPIYWSGDSGPIVLCLHGAGLSAGSFAPAAALSKSIHCQLVSFDFRAHGQNQLQEGEYDLTSNNLVSDTISVLSFIRQNNPTSNIVLVGHSMGGAIASKAGLEYQSNGGILQGLIIIDVVEGSAISALPYMDSIISQKPKGFRTLEKAIEWAYTSNTIKNLISAKVSIPTQIKNSDGGVVWKTDLKRTQEFWEGWFRGMNNAFLAFQGPKQLIIAASDRVDQQMMIAQMQGKYKHSVFFNVGHMIQEDDPSRFMTELHTFITTFKIS